MSRLLTYVVVYSVVVDYGFVFAHVCRDDGFTKRVTALGLEESLRLLQHE